MSQNNLSNRTYVRPGWQYKSAFDAARQIYRNEGVLTFYSGLTPALLGISHLAIQFPLYEKLKRRFTGSGLGETNGRSSYNTLGVLAAASMSKIVASSMTYPLEVIRTRFQTQQSLTSTTFTSPWHRGTMKLANTLWLKEGWRGFYAGMGTSMIRAVSSSVTTMLVYEKALSSLTAYKLNGERKLAKSNI